MSGKFDLSAALAKVEDVAPAVRTIEDLTRDILRNKQRAGVAILEIGKALIEAKELLPHGEWLPWLREQVEMSERGAQMYMQLARSGLNPQLVADLGLKKSTKLLALEPQEREAFIAEPHVVNGEHLNVVEMSTAQVEKAVKEQTTAREAPLAKTSTVTMPVVPPPPDTPKSPYKAALWRACEYIATEIKQFPPMSNPADDAPTCWVKYFLSRLEV